MNLLKKSQEKGILWWIPFAESLFIAEPFDPFINFCDGFLHLFQKNEKNPKNMKLKNFSAKKVSAFIMHQPNKVSRPQKAPACINVAGYKPGSS